MQPLEPERFRNRVTFYFRIYDREKGGVSEIFSVQADPQKRSIDFEILQRLQSFGYNPNVFTYITRGWSQWEIKDGPSNTASVVVKVASTSEALR